MATVVPVTTATLTANMQTYYDKLLLEGLEKNLVYYPLGDKKSIPRNAGKVIYFTKYTKFSANTTAITEGTVPDSISLSSANISATLSSWGDYVVEADLLTMTAIDNVIKSAVKELGYRARLTIDTLVRNVLSAGGTTVYGGTAAALSDVDASDTVSATNIRKAVRTLQNADVQTHSKGLYQGVIHPYVGYDIMSATTAGNWLDVLKYTTQTPANANEVGTLFGVRFQSTTNVATTTSGTSGAATAYYNSIIGDGAFGVVNIAGGALKSYVKQLGSAGSADPLNQLASIGYKITFATKELDSVRHIKLISGATA